MTAKAVLEKKWKVMGKQKPFLAKELKNGEKKKRGPT